MPAVALHISLALRLMESPKTVYSALMRDPTHAHSSCPVVTPMHPWPPSAFMPSTMASAACMQSACSLQTQVNHFGLIVACMLLDRWCMCRVNMGQKLQLVVCLVEQ